MAHNSESKNVLSIDEIPGDLIKKELHEVVKKLTGSENVELGIEPGSKKGRKSLNSSTFHKINNVDILILKQGDNFMGIIYRILFKNGGDNNIKKTSLILKIAPSDEMRRKTLGVRKLFLREVLMYNEVNLISDHND